jgi:hypothetical protein
MRREIERLVLHEEQPIRLMRRNGRRFRRGLNRSVRPVEFRFDAESGHLSSPT